jgi:hypothetical protein
MPAGLAALATVLSAVLVESAPVLATVSTNSPSWT